MRLRIERVALIGTSRVITFEPGLNVVLGDFTTGKTSLMRLLRVLLGSDFDGIIPELTRVSDVSGRLVVGDEPVNVVRRLTQTPTAPVDVAAGDFGARLPAMRGDGRGRESYGTWLMDLLGLPELRVPSAPTQPAESSTQPVSIADYLRYCRLTQKEIAADVLGSSMWFKDYKRRVVFGIYFGSYDADIAALQEELRRVQSEIRNLQQGTSAFDRFLEGTVLANRAVLEAELAEARQAKREVSERRAAVAAQAGRMPQVQEARSEVARLDSRLSRLRERLQAERQSVTDMRELGRQLRAQSARLTKAVVSAAHFVDFEFRVCPKCGQGVEAERAEAGSCHLCLQVPSEQLTREDLLVEQARVDAQIDETDELVAVHEQTAKHIEDELLRLERRRETAGQALDELTRTFISDSADLLTQLAGELSAATSRVAQFSEYLKLFDKAEAARARVEELQAQRLDVEDRLRIAERLDKEVELRVAHFERRFIELVENLRLPEFEEGADPRAAIHRGDYEPIVNGRRVEHHSGGMAVLVNVAYMLALHRSAIELDLRLPNLLMIDGINQNFGRGEYDSERYGLIWQRLVEYHSLYAERLQIIVATNDVPSFVEGLDVVRLRLTEADRLVPTESRPHDGSPSPGADLDGPTTAGPTA